MKSFMAEPTPAPIEPDDVRQVLERIFRSKHFVNAHKKRKFLRLICDFYLEGRAQELNEHILGYDVFGRDQSYNPSDDPIVRVFAYEIRKKLEMYYLQEGVNDPIRLEIPAGSYQPVFSRQPLIAEKGLEEEEAPLEAEARIETQPQRRSLLIPLMAVSLLLLGITVIALALSNRRLQQRVG